MAQVTNITPDDVRAIFPTTLSDDSLIVFVDTGVALFNEIFSSVEYSEERSTQIALFLIAHLASTASPRMEMEDIGDYRYKIMGKTGEGLRSTHYGQTALLLDTDGALETLGKQRARFTAFDIRNR